MNENEIIFLYHPALIGIKKIFSRRIKNQYSTLQCKTIQEKLQIAKQVDNEVSHSCVKTF